MKQYESQIGLTEQVPEAKRDVNSDKTGEIVSGMGKGIAELGSRFAKLRDDQQHMAAENLMAKASDDFVINLTKDPDVWRKPEKIDEFFSKSVAEASALITSPEARIRFKESAQESVNQKRRQALVSVMNEQSQLYKGTYINTLNRLKKEYTRSAPQVQENIIGRMKDQAKRAIENKGVPAKEATNHLNQLLKNLPMYTLQANLGTALSDPKTAVSQVKAIESELSKGDSGMFRGMPPEKLLTAHNMIEQAKTHAEKLDEEGNRLQQHLADKSATSKWVSGDLDADTLLKSKAKMSDERFKSLYKYSLKGDFATEHNPEEYMKALDYISDGSKTERDCINNTIDMVIKGKLTDAEGKDIVKAFMLAPEDDPNFNLSKKPKLIEMLRAQEEKDQKSKEKRTGGWLDLIKSGVTRGGAFGSGSELAKKVIQSFNGSKESKDPKFAMTQANKVMAQENLKRHPDWASFPKEGTVLVDGHGNRARCYSDGRVEEIV